MSRHLRILMYSHNTRGLGHAARMVSLAWGIQNVIPDANILCCTGGMQGLIDLLPPHADLVKLPSFDAVEKDGQLVLFPARLVIERKELISIRRAILSAVAETYDPDVLIADYTPLGKDEELEPSVVQIRSRDRRLVLVGIRDMMHDPTHLEVDLLPPLRKYFDAALVYSDPNWSNFLDNNNVPIDMKKQFIHTGYVVNDKVPSRRRVDILRELNVPINSSLVVLGLGGGKDAVEILGFAIEAWELLIPNFQAGVYLLVIAGPYIRPAQWQWAQDRINGMSSIRLVHHVQYPLEYLQAASLYIGACGYNTFTEIMQAKSPAIFIPRVQVDSDEQFSRANDLKHKGHWEVIDSRQASPEDLAECIERMLNSSPPERDPIDLKGADYVGTLIAQWARK